MFLSTHSADLTLPTIDLLHKGLSCASSFFNPHSFMSSFTHSIHVFLGLPFLTPPTTSKFLHLETQSSAPLRFTCPNHLSLPCLTTLSTPTIPSPRLSSSLDLLSFRVTPDIHLIMLFSVLTSLCISSTFNGQVSLPYTGTLCTHALYIFPLTLNEAPLTVNNLLRFLNFPHAAHLTLARDASSAPPPFPITSPKFVNNLQLLHRSQHNLSYSIHHFHPIPRTVPALEVPHLRYLR